MLYLVVREDAVVDANVVEKAVESSSYSDINVLAGVDGPKVEKADVVYFCELAVFVEPDVIVEVGQLGFEQDDGHVMPFVVVYLVVDIVVSAAGCQADASPYESVNPHLAEVVGAPGYDFTSGAFCFDPGGHGSRFCAGDAFVFGYFDVIVAFELECLSDAALGGIFVKRQISHQGALAFMFGGIGGGLAGGLIELPPADKMRVGVEGCGFVFACGGGTVCQA